jgi:phosphopantothenoylcysteine decarboxylase/phosphopantothenate--cysteine ligase
MKVLITLGGTREPVDPVRYLGNRSSGRMGMAFAEAVTEAGHDVTLIAGNVSVELPIGTHRAETTRQMHDAVLATWPEHDMLIMAAAVADFRPKVISDGKLRRTRELTLELEPTEDILAAAGAMKRSDQILVGFSLDEDDDAARERAVEKLRRKRCDWLVFNPLPTLDSGTITATLLAADGHQEQLAAGSKHDVARRLLHRILSIAA